ncbi:MAG: mannonate dehydratase [Clostridiales bacterium]|jgi:mannonate dehydratase|nr:mannonate dehydratase [Clostridiales bacterium]
MKMVLRWFPYGDDSVTLKQIRQTPGISGVATCFPNIPVGDVWQPDMLAALKRELSDAGLEMEVIESYNVHEDIKKGLPSRDRYIENYIESIRNMAAAGVKCICYNFMPALDWIRSDLAFELPDGSNAMSYRHELVLARTPQSIIDSTLGSSMGFSLPGWEPERLRAIAADIEFYQGMGEEAYWEHLRYFLAAVIPAAERYDVRMGVHPDDPPWPIYGLPKIICSAQDVRRFLSLYDSPYNGLTLCTGSLGSNIHNDLPAIAAEFAVRIPFAHLRNVRHLAERDFDESAHLSACGDIDMFAVAKALHDNGFDGYARPDHRRAIWGEKARPGYGFYDRAIGANYLWGLWEAICKMGGDRA